MAKKKNPKVNTTTGDDDGKNEFKALLWKFGTIVMPIVIEWGREKWKEFSDKRQKNKQKKKSQDNGIQGKK